MSKKISQIPAGIEISKGRINVKILVLIAAVIMMVPVSAQGQPPRRA